MNRKKGAEKFQNGLMETLPEGYPLKK